MITRKAAIGFILLTIIVFPTAYFSWTAPMPLVPDRAKPIDLTKFEHTDLSNTRTVVYRPPVVQFDNPFDMALAVTGIIEVFTFCCYLTLKRIEPYIVEWEKSERANVVDTFDGDKN